METMNVGIINVTGYIGVELARLLWQHPGVHLVSVTGRSAVGEKLGEVFPHLADVDLTIESELGEGVDLAFSALPHAVSAEAAAAALEHDIKVIDTSADFRLKDVEEYQRWYKVTHPSPELLSEAVYGLPELHRAEISEARLVANPGCYPTSAILALAPAIREGIIEPDVIIDSKSGVSGAGRTPTLTTHYAEVNENVSAYALDGHRHLPEIVQELQDRTERLSLSVTFVPHLIPMTRGILSSCYARLRSEIGVEGIREIYRDFYRDEPFVRVVDSPPQTKHTWGSNLCLVHPTVDRRTGRLVVISCLDNLVKGGAGQALQNMNLMLGFPEGMGLGGITIYP
ncbi:MAG: N-acetyl-gamma-glutamyl-phosphate reductase [Dehalococcoidia bacterium]|nr:N-acetyl-gamma-glutamyl-phosphate reductase [Chloroflexota bacterium]MBT9160678.1 N-acetyl-gamma-glutamyl-phosphate reductase [Chloroflexota bacterium]MBT9162495.1 N-acetyl-gamma-glutamyl-phosphate reductase [Chloroflexota bacterium]